MIHNIAQPPALCARTAVKGPIGPCGTKSGSRDGRRPAHPPTVALGPRRRLKIIEALGEARKMKKTTTKPKSTKAPAAAHPLEGKPAPDFELPDAKGHAVKLRDLTAKGTWSSISIPKT